jgi:hypothetical protein
MSLFIQDTFAEARNRGLLDGFVGTYADLKELIHQDFLAEDATFEGIRQAEAKASQWFAFPGDRAA